jgi:hypothetical protein
VPPNKEPETAPGELVVQFTYEIVSALAGMQDATIERITNNCCFLIAFS